MGRKKWKPTKKKAMGYPISIWQTMLNNWKNRKTTEVWNI
jgi:hypothetical protein